MRGHQWEWDSEGGGIKNWMFDGTAEASFTPDYCYVN